jgi:hypothetical protein
VNRVLIVCGRRVLARRPFQYAIAGGAIAALSLTPEPAHRSAAAAALPFSAAPPRAVITENYNRLPLAFEVNAGQTDPRVKFLSRGAGYTLFLTDTAAVFALRPGAGDPRHAASVAPPASIRMTLLDTNADARFVAGDALAGESRYFTGDDPSKWRPNVKRYAQVRNNGVYPGIDVVYYGNQRQLEYDFIVAPGADSGRIAFNVEGADRVEVDPEGHLLMHIAGRHVRLNKPFTYQEVNGARTEVESRYAVERDTVRIDVGEYDPARTLVIDPVLVFSTFLSGNGEDLATGVAVDGAGNAYVVGITSSTNFPTTPGVAQTTFGGGVGLFGFPADVFVTKINGASSGISFSTYLGGEGDDLTFDVALDGIGNVYVAGITTQRTAGGNNFPTTNGAFQTTYQGGESDAFVTKLFPDGTLGYSTYVGGGCGDDAFGISVDSGGNAYVAAQSKKRNTCTQNFPVTPGAYITTPGAGGEDAIAFKLNSTGSALVYATYLRGSASNGCPPCPDESVHDIAVDGSGNAFIVGDTGTTDFPTTVGAYQTAYAGGDADGFLTKFNSTGTALLYSTYLGGQAGFDSINSIAIDASGSAYLTGMTTSSNFPRTPGAYQDTHGPDSDVFVTKINAAGSTLVYSTLLGGTTGTPDGSQIANGIAIDSLGHAFVSGHTRATNFPTTPGAVQPIYGGGSGDGSFLFCRLGNCDAFVAKFNTTGTGLLYSTYLGGTSNDDAWRIAVSAANRTYLVGATASTNFPGSGAATLSGPSDAVVVALKIPVRVLFDGNPDGATDRTVFRPSSGVWYSALSGNGGATASGWGVSTDIDVMGDYDGDSKADLAVYRPSLGTWYILQSTDNSVRVDTWGVNGDVPIAADIDGDGKDDLVIFRESAGAWFMKKSTGGTSTLAWGTTGDYPLRGDYDGDGKDDAAIYRPASGSWYVALSGGGTTTTEWGAAGDSPVVGDFDGDGMADITIYRPGTGQWWVKKSSGGTQVVTWGTTGDIPVSGDWDGDGASDFTVFRDTAGVWYTQFAAGGTSAVGWGVSGDKPAGRRPGS